MSEHLILAPDLPLFGAALSHAALAPFSFVDGPVNSRMTSLGRLTSLPKATSSVPFARSAAAPRLPWFVYAGIAVELRGLFAGVRGRQIAGRFASIATTPFAMGARGSARSGQR